MSIQFVPLPYPPAQYNQQYVNELIRVLNLYFRAIQNQGPVVGNTAQFTNLPTSATGLPAGSLWVDTSASNVVKVVL
jgi:hypothetical protein